MAEEIVIGKVTRQPYLHDVTLFSIIELMDEQGHLFTAKGTIRKVAAGEMLALTGTWQNDRRGRYLKFSAWSWQETDDKMAVISMLQLLPHVGPKSAELIWDHFGKDSLGVIRSNPRQLMLIKGFSLANVNDIERAQEELFAMGDVLRLLSPYGISQRRIRRWFLYAQKQPKDHLSTQDWMMKHPYSACMVSGIGFLTADRIAFAMGLPPQSHDRIIEAFSYVLIEAEMEGHTCLPKDKLIEKTASLLTKTGRPVDVGFLASVFPMWIKQRAVMEEGMVYLRSVYEEEKRVAHHVAQLCATPITHPTTSSFSTLLGLIDGHEKLNEEQRSAVLAMESHRFVVLTGGPGTGKSTTLDMVLKVLRKAHEVDIRRGRYHIGLCAPTGKAAKCMEEIVKEKAFTTHRLLGIRYTEEDMLGVTYHQGNPLPYDLLIMDETSMTDQETFDWFLSAIDPRKTQVLIVGDEDQLPSVGAGMVLHSLLHANICPVIRLEQVYRQAEGSAIAFNAKAIREGKKKGWQWDEDFAFYSVPEPDDMVNVLLTLINRYEAKGVPRTDIRVLTPMRKNTVIGASSLNLTLQEIYNPKQEGDRVFLMGDREFRMGDPVMQWKNNYDLELFNGTTGIIQSIEGGSSLSILWDDGRTLTMTRDDMETILHDYATTVHKSQGSEYDTCIILVHSSHARLLERNMLYTAITRAKKRVILLGEKKALAMAIDTKNSRNRYSRLLWRLQQLSVSA